MPKLPTGTLEYLKHKTMIIINPKSTLQFISAQIALEDDFPNMAIEEPELWSHYGGQITINSDSKEDIALVTDLLEELIEDGLNLIIDAI